MGAMLFIIAFNSKSFWEIAACVFFGACLLALGIKEWRYRNRKRR
jgi:hypothetical protein